MPPSQPDPEQTTDVQELIGSSGCINPNVGITIAPTSVNAHRRNPSNISKEIKKINVFYPPFVKEANGLIDMDTKLFTHIKINLHFIIQYNVFYRQNIRKI